MPARLLPSPGPRALLVLLLALLGPAASAAPLGEADRRALFQAAGLVPQGEGWGLADCAGDLRPEVELHDLDGDGRSEAALFLVASRCLPQHPGGSVGVYARSADGGWRPILARDPGVELVPQPGRTEGWRDLGLATSGGCMPLYRWDGQQYRRHAQKTLQPGGCSFRE